MQTPTGHPERVPDELPEATFVVVDISSKPEEAARALFRNNVHAAANTITRIAVGHAFEDGRKTAELRLMFDAARYVVERVVGPVPKGEGDEVWDNMLSKLQLEGGVDTDDMREVVKASRKKKRDEEPNFEPELAWNLDEEEDTDLKEL